MDEPDYTAYTLDELEDARTHIDKERYAARHRRILDEIEKRRAAGPAEQRRVAARDAASPPRVPGRPFPIGKVIVGLAIVGVIGIALAAVFVVPRVASLFGELSEVRVAVRAAHPDETVSIHLTTSADSRTLQVVFTDSELADLEDEEKRGAAREIALVALGAYPGDEPLDEIVVIFRSVDEAGPVRRTDDSDAHRFDPDELQAPGPPPAGGPSTP